ncbi:HAD-IA family hydrolase [Plantactinospora solaniradicis]|uniref:HAD-IA family hydrolase n=1 Tax=Plantactinospora solaniradicis TaxID=1723736 RepID=A0ABW1KNZ4_9ACTN
MPTDPGTDADAVIWCDFGGVLTPPMNTAMDAIVAASGVPWPVLAAAAETVAADEGLRGFAPLELGLLSQAEWGRRLTAALPTDVRPRVDLRDWDRYWYRDRPLNHTLVEELRRLRQRGLRIGLLTNSVLEWEPHRDRMLAGIDIFIQVVRSHQLGIAKPDPRIYEHAARVLETRGDILLIDDLAQNCRAAEQHGWAAIKHRDNPTTIDALRSRFG